MDQPHIAVDLLSGDHPPEQLVQGIFHAAQRFKCYLTGIVPTSLQKLTEQFTDASWVYTDDAVRMDEMPSSALRRMPRASIAIATSMLASGQVDAIFSPGHTGATLTASVLNLKRMEGVRRPALAMLLSGGAIRPKILIDSGANVVCKPDYLVQFAVMGIAYARHKFKKSRPTVGLLNIGSEEYKGTELTIDTYKKLSKLRLDFVGNMEGDAVLTADVDVIVSDGYTGNVVLKLIESFLRLDPDWEPDDFAAPLLGVQGLVMVGHGSTNAETLVPAIESTLRLVNSHMLRDVTRDIKKLQKKYLS